MNKARMALRLGGALAVLLVLVSLIACSESTKHDETVSVAIREQGSTYSRSLSIDEDNTESYTTKDSSELYWTYTAKKNDGYFTTGQTDETWISTDEDGNAALDLPSTLPGKFSVGAWVFTFNAYTSADLETDDDEDGYPDSLFYSGSATTVQLSSGGDNTVSVNVQLQEAVGDTGYLNIHDLVLKEDADDNESVSFTSSFSVWVQLDSDDAEQIATYTTSDEGSSWTLYGVDIMGLVDEDEETSYTATLDVGYHAVTVYTVTSDDEINGYSSEENILIQANLTTVLTGSVDALTEEVSISSDINVSYGSVTVSSATELAEALADSQISTVVLTESVTLESCLEVENDTVIELGSYTITSSADVFSVAAGASLTVTADSSGAVSTTGSNTTVFSLADSDDSGTASLTINGGTYSSGDVVVYASASADITITDGTFSGTDIAVCAYNSGTLNISGGTFEGDLAIDLNAGSATATPRSNNLTVNITGGTFTGSSMALNVSGYLSASDNITINITDGTFIGEVYIAGYTTTTISGGTFTDSSTSTDASYGMQPLHIRSGKITITGGSFINNHPLSYATWDYFYTASGSMEHYRDIVIEASNASSFGALDSVTLTSGITTGNSGILYAINPGYTGSTPSSSIDSSLSVTQHSSTDLLYYIPFYYLSSSYAYFTSLSGAQTALSAMSSSYFYNQSIYAYDSGSGNWSVYSE